MVLGEAVGAQLMTISRHGPAAARQTGKLLLGHTP
jgi:hypothetical protein